MQHPRTVSYPHQPLPTGVQRGQKRPRSAPSGTAGANRRCLGSHDGSLALISSPVYPYGGARYNTSIFVASAASGFKDWGLVGQVFPGDAW